jgi:hypothetical protein
MFKKRVWKEVVVAYFSELSRHSAGRSEETRGEKVKITDQGSKQAYKPG